MVRLPVAKVGRLALQSANREHTTTLPSQLLSPPPFPLQKRGEEQREGEKHQKPDFKAPPPPPPPPRHLANPASQQHMTVQAFLPREDQAGRCLPDGGEPGGQSCKQESPEGGLIRLFLKMKCRFEKSHHGKQRGEVGRRTSVRGWRLTRGKKSSHIPLRLPLGQARLCRDESSRFCCWRWCAVPCLDASAAAATGHGQSVSLTECSRRRTSARH